MNDQEIHDNIAEAKRIASSVRQSMGPNEPIPSWAIALESLAEATAELARRLVSERS